MSIFHCFPKDVAIDMMIEEYVLVSAPSLLLGNEVSIIEASYKFVNDRISSYALNQEQVTGLLYL